jgi:hypothetical protein
MRRTRTVAIPLLAVLVLLVGMGAGACAGGEGEEATPPPTSATPTPPATTPASPTPPATTRIPLLPKPGEWTAATGSSKFTFTLTVSPDSTGIAKVSFNFAEFKCGGVQSSGGVSVENRLLWPITGGKFNVDAEVRPWDIVIKGTFDESGTHATGTWEISSGGTSCQTGTWESSRGS